MTALHSILFGTKPLLKNDETADYKAMCARRAIRDEAERLMFVTGLPKRRCVRMVLRDMRKLNDPLPF